MENQLPASRTRTVVVDRRTVTEGDVGEQGAVPEYVSLYRSASGLPRQAVVWLGQDGAKEDARSAPSQHRQAERLWRSRVPAGSVYLRSSVVWPPRKISECTSTRTWPAASMR